MFIGRKKELEVLTEHYKSPHFAFLPIYGRRRIGKTLLIEEFIKDKEAIFFAAVDGTYAQNMDILSQAIFKSGSAPVFADFASALNAIFDMAQTERKIVFVIDEYPYFAQSERSVSSVLQQAIDHKLSKTDMMIILSGSSMSFMENQVLGYQSPLYGRRSGQIKLLPENFATSREYAPGFSKEEQAIMYGVTGGIPKYLSLFDDRKTLDDNIFRQFFDKNNFLFEETDNLLKQELNEPAFYKAIISAIATGSSQMKDIAGQTGRDSSTCSMYLRSLIELGIVQREIPVMEKQQSKKSIYRINDGMFRFWYRFVYHNVSLIQLNRGDIVYQRIKDQIPHFMGEVFEHICIEYMWRIYGKLPFRFQNIGRWWGNNPVKKSQQEIDFIAHGDDSKKAIFGECKWRSEKMPESVIDELVDKATMFRFTEKYYYFFSKSGFTPAARKKAGGNIKLIDFKDMF